ncbi:hypothetical protein REPUB_Repub07fG0121900 [Reevesia pubescens]
MLYSCGLCDKGYRSSKAHAQHLKSRTHIQRASQGTNHPEEEKAIVKPLPCRAVNRPPPPRYINDDDSEDEWVEVDQEEYLVAQLELQVDGGFNQNFNSKTLSAPNLSTLDFPTLTMSDGQSGPPKYEVDDLHHSANPYRSSEKDNMLMFKSSYSLASRGAIDFATAVRKRASQDFGMWKCEGNGFFDSTVGSSRSSHGSANTYSAAPGRGVYANRLQTRSLARSAPIWLETGNAVTNLYTELREEARDHARLRNAYFEQAQQAFVVGNKALAKELSVKGQLHNMRMKAAHEKA